MQYRYNKIYIGLDVPLLSYMISFVNITAQTNYKCGSNVHFYESLRSRIGMKAMPRDTHMRSS